MKLFLFGICLSIPLALLSQNKAEERLLRCIQKKEYTKGLRIAHIINQSNPSSTTYLYSALLWQGKALNQTGPVNLQWVKQSFWEIRKGAALDYSASVFNHNAIWYDSLIYGYHILCQNLIQGYHKTEAKAIATQLAKEFGDTLECYYIFYPRPTLHSPIPIDLGKKENLSFSDSLLWLALQFVNTPYKVNEFGPKHFDDLGYIYYITRHFGINLPIRLDSLAKLGNKEVKDLQNGDLLLFGKKRAFHVAFYIKYEGNEYLLHCVKQGVTVDIWLKNSFWHQQSLYKVIRLK